MSIQHTIALATLGLLLASCAATPTPSPAIPASSAAIASREPAFTPVGGIAATRDLDAIGAPASFGSWELRGSAVPLEPSGPFAGIVEAAGGDLGVAKDVSVEAMNGSEVVRFDALLLPGIEFDAFVTASAPFIGQTGETARSELIIAGWTVVRFATPGDFAGPPSSVEVVARDGDDLILMMGDTSDETLARLLADWPA